MVGEVCISGMLDKQTHPQPATSRNLLYPDREVAFLMTVGKLME